MRNYKDLIRLAETFGFIVTSTTGGKHNRASKHFLGLAIDVRTFDKTNKEIERLMLLCSMLGVRVLDERKRPVNQAVWSGSHLHLDIGAETTQAVREFQARNNLMVDGIAGEETLAALASLA